MMFYLLWYGELLVEVLNNYSWKERSNKGKWQWKTGALFSFDEERKVRVFQ